MRSQIELPSALRNLLVVFLVDNYKMIDLARVSMKLGTIDSIYLRYNMYTLGTHRDITNNIEEKHVF